MHRLQYQKKKENESFFYTPHIRFYGILLKSKSYTGVKNVFVSFAVRRVDKTNYNVGTYQMRGQKGKRRKKKRIKKRPKCRNKQGKTSIKRHCNLMVKISLCVCVGVYIRGSVYSFSRKQQCAAVPSTPQTCPTALPTSSPLHHLTI